MVLADPVPHSASDPVTHSYPPTRPDSAPTAGTGSNQHDSGPTQRADDMVLKMFSPSDYEWLRRQKNRTVTSVVNKGIKIPPEFRTEPVDAAPNCSNCPNWKKYIHPDGATYFHYEKTGKISVLTDANVQNQDIRNSLNTKWIPDLDCHVRTRGLHSEFIELVLHFQETGTDKGRWAYYLADTENKSIFWFHEFEAKELPIWNEVPGVSEKPHIWHEIVSQYWLHCSLFPNTRKVENELISDLRDIVTYDYHVVSMSEDSSTVAPTAYQSKTMLEAISAAEKHVGQVAPGLMFVLSHLMHLQARHRFVHFHGQPSARLLRKQAIYGDTPTATQCSFSFLLLSPFLFFAPQFHLRTLRAIHFDHAVYASTLKKAVEKLDDEWKGIIINSNVLLNASVALSGRGSPGSTVQIFGYASVALSTSSVIVGLLLVRQNKTNKRDNIKHGLKFLSKHSEEGLAILYSLPYALLMWSTIAFVGSFTSLFFAQTDTITRTILGVGCTGITALIVWCIFYSWEGRGTGRDNEGSVSSTESRLESSVTVVIDGDRP